MKRSHWDGPAKQKCPECGGWWATTAFQVPRKGMAQVCDGCAERITARDRVSPFEETMRMFDALALDKLIEGLAYERPPKPRAPREAEPDTLASVRADMGAIGRWQAEVQRRRESPQVKGGLTRRLRRALRYYNAAHSTAQKWA